MSVIGRAPNYELLDIFAKRLKKSYGIESIWREDSTSSRKIISAFKTGRVVAALIDQDTSIENAFAPFFGVDAAYPSSLITLAVKYRIPIITSFIIREQPYHHNVITDRIDYDPDSETVIQDILKTFSKRLEDLIIKYHEQWIWWHRRWRRRPGMDYNLHPETLPSTKDYLSWLNNQA